MKIVNIEDFFHPNAGYQINIISKYLSKFGHEVIIVTSQMHKIPEGLITFFDANNIEEKDKKYEAKTGVKIIRLPIKMFVSGRAIFTKELQKCIKRLKPDVLYVHGNDTLSGITYINQLGKLDFALVSDSHMLEMASKNKFNQLFRKYYRNFITPKIIKYKMPVIRTQNDNYIQNCLGIPLSQAPWISYGSDLMLFHPSEKAREKFRNRNAIKKDAFVILYAGKLDEAKGGLFLAESLKEVFQCRREIVFMIVGNTTQDEYGTNIEKIFSESKNCILRFQTQQYENLAEFYQSSDLAIFPKQCSLSFYDVQACGLPVVFEDNNINIERCKHNNGWTFRSGNVKDFRLTIERVVNMDNTEYKKKSISSHQFIYDNYNYEIKAREYEKILKSEYERFQIEHNRSF